jgi:hypothetical protein
VQWVEALTVVTLGLSRTSQCFKGVLGRAGRHRSRPFLSYFSGEYVLVWGGFGGLGEKDGRGPEKEEVGGGRVR